jgi:hypothetical protein
MRQVFDLGMLIVSAAVAGLVVLAFFLPAHSPPPQKKALSSILYRDGQIVP